MTLALDRRGRRNLGLLWAGQFVSATGDALFLMAVTWIAGRVGGDGLSVGGAVFLAAVPFLVFGPFAGALVDRVDHRRLMIASDVLRAGVLLALPWVVTVAGGLTWGLVAAAAFVVATLSTPFLPARDALLPELVGGASLQRANATVQTSWQLAQILGLAIGGALLARDAGDEVDRVLGALRYDGATFLVSALALSGIVVARRPAAPGPRRSFRADVREGWRYALSDPVVRPLLVLTALNNLALMGPAMVGPVLLLQRDLGLTAGHLAWFEGGMATGMLVGAAVIARRGRTTSAGSLLLAGMILDGITYLPLAFLPSYAMMLPMIVFHGLFIPCILVGRTSLVQVHVPPGHRGKVFALVGLTVSGMTALSAFASGLVAEAVGARGLFLVAGIVATLVGVVGWLGLRPRFVAAERAATAP